MGRRIATACGFAMTGPLGLCACGRGEEDADCHGLRPRNDRPSQALRAGSPRGRAKMGRLQQNSPESIDSGLLLFIKFLHLYSLKELFNLGGKLAQRAGDKGRHEARFLKKLGPYLLAALL